MTLTSPYPKPLKLYCPILVIGLFVMVVHLAAQPIKSIKVNHYSSSHKLPGASVQCMFQDKIGILWLGIESEGLTKYDGKTFTVYKSNAKDSLTISNNYPVEIIDDNQGFLWIATLNGLNRFNKNTGIFTRYHRTPGSNNSLASNVLNGMVKDSFGFLWIATANGISIVNPERQEIMNILYNSNDAMPVKNTETTSIEIDKDNNIYIGSLLHGLYLIPESAYKPIFERWKKEPLSQFNERITAIQSINQQFPEGFPTSIRSLEQQGDTLWLGTQSGLYVYNTKQATIQKKVFDQAGASNVNNATILKLFIDSRQNLWVGTSSDGLLVISGTNHETNYLNASQYSTNQLSSNAIRDIIESKSGLIWIATKFGGLHYYDRRQETFQLIKKSSPNIPGIADDFVLCLLEDSRKNLWIGTKNGGITMLDAKRQTFKTINTASTLGMLKSNRIEMMIEDELGNIWLGTEAGLAKLDPKTLKISYYNSIHVRNILYSKEGHFWLGTTFGLYRFSPITGKSSPVTTKHNDFFDIESNISVTRIFEDRFGIIWIGTSTSGLFLYNTQTDELERYTHNSADPYSISGNLIRAIYEDKSGDIWIGTKSDGLNRFNRKLKQFEHFQSEDDLSSNTIYSILEDDLGNLWMGTHNGIVKFNNSHEFESYGLNYGLQSLIFEINASAALHDGMFALGGSQGLNIFNPKTVARQSYNAPVIVSKFAISNKEVDTDIHSNVSYRLNQSSNYLTFEFALLDYSEPDANKYAYFLENFDNEWVYSGNRNYVTYTNLPPGNYTFKAKAANSDGTWTTEGISIDLFIPTPIWHTWWFITLLLILLLTAIYTYYNRRSKAVQRQRMQLEQEVEERTKELTTAYSKLEESKGAIMQRNEELLRKSKQIIIQNQELEKHRQHLELLVKARTKDLEASKQKAEESDMLKSAFLANMSHEIRTPLNAIMGFLDILEDDELPKSEKLKIHNIVLSNGNMLLQLINDIIDISLIEANQIKLHWSFIDMRSFVESIKADYAKHKELESKGITLSTLLPSTPDLREVYTAPERVKQIYCNLINNAIKFTSGGSITFGYDIDIEANAIKCFVRDTGCGIPQKDADVIFNRFRKLDNDNTIVHRGTGLGLAISKNLCELMGGTIWVESEPGEGSTFYFKLPLTHQPSNESENNHNKDREELLLPNFSGKTILVAEDEDSNFEVIKYILRKTNVEIVRCHDGLEAVETMLNEANHFDLVLMDLKMPRLNGIEATKFIKEAFPNMPVIALTAYALETERNNYVQMGFDAYLTKPINTPELYGIMQRLFK
jgi:signal transduction histidine kinase/ligand-binding sensor domain-containing protein/CheY-like chemotaxis protein